MRQEIKLSDLQFLWFKSVCLKDQLWCSRDHRMVQWIYGGDDITCVSLITLLVTMLARITPTGSWARTRWWRCTAPSSPAQSPEHLWTKYSKNLILITVAPLTSRFRFPFHEFKEPLKIFCSVFIIIHECVRSSCWPLTCLRRATLKRNWDGLSKCMIEIFLFKNHLCLWSILFDYC